MCQHRDVLDDVEAPPRRSDLSRFAPWAFVALAIGFNLWVLRGELLPAQNLNDGSIHDSMIRWARYRIQTGHLPFDGWYPYLSLGSSRFHHYQSLGHIVAAYLAIVFSTGHIYQWTLYLLLSFWPLAVYWGMRLFGFEPLPSALAALVSPLLASAPGLGYEDGSYAWRGYGVWTQLWGMWMLPLAWGLTWRAVSRRGSYALAALALAVTIALHLLTGYLAVLSVGVWVLLRWREFVPRLGRAAIVIVGTLLIASYMLVPLLVDVRFMPQSEISRGTIYYDSFGFWKVLGWAGTGQLFDRGRVVSVISIAVLIGLIVALRRFRHDERVRAVIGVGLLSLYLFFGRPVAEPLLHFLPGSSDLYLRRYIFGVHLAGIYLAGIGLAAVASLVRRWFERHRPRWDPITVTTVLVVGLLVALYPAWSERVAWNAQGGIWIHEQLQADVTDGADVASLVHEAESMGPGRFYAGVRGRLGERDRIGQVQTYAYLLDLDADAIGFTRPAWSLSSAPEIRFEDFDRAHYRLFGVHYLILPAKIHPLVPATRIDKKGGHTLWTVGKGAYFDVVDTRGTIVADRTDLGAQTTAFLSSDAVRSRLYPTIAFAGAPAAPATDPRGTPRRHHPGRIVFENDHPADGTFTARVVAKRRSMVVLSASFDNRWTVTVDGEPRPAQMVAPSLVGRNVPPGRHTVEFRYRAFPAYGELLALGALSLLGLWVGQREWRQRRLLSPRPSHARLPRSR